MPAAHAASHAAGADLAVAVAVGIEAVVLRVERDLSAGDVDDQGLDPFIALFDQDCSVFNIHGRIGMNAVIACGEGEVTARDSDVAGRVDAVISGRDLESTGFYVQIPVFRLVGGDETVVA